MKRKTLKKSATQRVSITMKKKQIIEALEKSLGVVTTALKSLNYNRKTFYDYYNSDPIFAQKCDEIQNMAIDFVESKLFENIKNGNVVAQIFYLKTKAKSRGYVEKTEVQHNIENITIKPIDDMKKLNEGNE